MDQYQQVLKLLNEASDALEARGDSLIVAQLSQPIATIEAKLQTTQRQTSPIGEHPVRPMPAAIQ